MKVSVLLLMLALLLFNCASKIKDNQTKTPKVMKEIQIIERKGIVDFWEELNKYTISYSAPNTIDQKFTCVVPDKEMIPIPLRKPGTAIIFSGTLVVDPNLPAPRMGGEQILLLVRIEKIITNNK